MDVVREPIMPKQTIRDIVDALPDDASYEEIIAELALNRLIERGLADARAGRLIPDDAARARMLAWRR
jgi:hypothetical protein